MISLHPLHNRYIANSNAKLKECTAQLNTLVDAVHHLSLLLASNSVTWSSSIVSLDGINKMIEGISAIKGNGETRGIYRLYYSNDEINSITSTCNVDSFLLQSYVKSIILNLRKQTTILNLIDYYTLCATIPVSIFEDIIKDVNFENQKFILKGGTLELRYGLGKIFIREKKQNTNGKGNLLVNWNESWNVLISIAKAQEEVGTHDLYSQYTSKRITIKELIKLMKPYTYNKNDAPDKPKWLIYQANDNNYWVTWIKGFGGMPNESFYSFSGNRLYDATAPTQNEYIKTCKSNDDILESKQYGLERKLNMLIKYDNNYYLNFRR